MVPNFDCSIAVVKAMELVGFDPHFLAIVFMNSHPARL
jgi:hypothetical protein